MLQYLDPHQRFRALIDEVSRQIQHTDFSDWEIAENCCISTEFIRRQRQHLSLRQSYAHLLKEAEMRKKHEISYDDLHREYIGNEKTIAQCAEVFGCSRGTIATNLREHGIQARPRGGNTRKKSSEGLETSVNGKPPAADVAKITTPEPDPALEVKKCPRLLERLMLLSAVKGTSIQDLIEESLELLFEKYGEKT